MEKFILTISFLFLTSASYTQWEPVSIPGEDTVYCLSSVNQCIIAGCKNSVYRSLNYGLKWISSGNGLNYSPVKVIENINSNFYLGSNNIFKSSNMGINWFCINNQFSNFYAYSFLSTNNYLLCGVSSGILKTTNEGINWILLTNGLNAQDIKCIKNIGNLLFAGTSNGIYRSFNQGDYWTLNYAQGVNVNCFASYDTKLFAGITNYGVKVTTNLGYTWENFNTGLNNFNINSLIIYSDIIFAGTDIGVFASPVNDNYWILYNSGFDVNPKVNCLNLFKNYIYAGTSGKSVWRRMIFDFAGIENNISNIPDKISLSQNYPNPFNPNTIIKFQINKNSFVSLKIYDVLGIEVATVVNKFIKAGEYETTFKGSGFTSGIYFYKLTAGNFSETRKMILLK